MQQSKSRPTIDDSPERKHDAVLVVDDSVLQRQYLCTLLKQLGFVDIRQAANGREALTLLESCANPIDYVLSDLDMPDMDGVELLRGIAARGLARRVVVVSAWDPKVLDAIESMAAEDDSFPLLGTMHKPFTKAQLTEVLDRPLPCGHESATHTIKPALDEIEQGLTRGEFVPYYQPKVDFGSGAMRGAEALARWQHPHHGLLSPAHFIPTLEGSALMTRFTLAMLEQIVFQLARWSGDGFTLVASVNLSARDLLDETIADRIAALTGRSGVRPDALVFEVTETMVMTNLSSCLGNLARLRLKGFGLSMDDFGIGYSSMQQLSRCPFTELKIDRAFVDRASSQHSRKAILESAIEMSKRLGIVSVAEGIEHKDDWGLLRRLGCSLGQGYFLGRPMAAAELPGWACHNELRLRALAEPI